MPALQLDVVHVGSAQTIRIAPRSGNMSFSHHPTRRMKFNPGRSSLQLLSVYISKFLGGGSIYIEINWQKTKLLAVSISYSDAVSMAW